MFSPRATAELLDSTEAEVINNLNELETYYPQQKLRDGNRVSQLESSLYMQNQLLKDTDFMSMWHGLEIRVPFLDKFLMNAAAQVCTALKFNKNLPKYLLIEAFKDQLPAEIWNRKKQGFTFPFITWLKNAEFIQPETEMERKLFKQFHSNKLSWSRYWSVLLMNRFAQPSFA